MSIASELTDLSTNLQNAKDAVAAKGGTVGDTGLAGLATEIQTIPSGGGGGANSLSITNKSDFASPIAMPTNGTFTQVSLSVTTDPADSYYFVESSNPSSAKVVYENGNYAIRFIAPGTATIRAYSGSAQDTVSVSATQTTTAIALNGLPAFCDKGTTYQLVATYTPSTSASNGVNWSSSDTSAATVDTDGLVTFLAAGSVTITATSKTQTSVSKTTSANVVVNETDPDLDAIHDMLVAGTAQATYPVGSTLNFQYKEGTNPAETMPVKVMDYRQVELEGGQTVNGMIIRPLCTRTTRRYSGAIPVTNLTASSGETTAQDGYYYYTSANEPLNLQTGDPLDFSTNPTIKKTTYNVDTATKMASLVNYGDRRWAYSDARAWLNSTYLGYYSSTFTNHLGKVKVTTVNDKYVWNGEVVDTYDYFYLPSNVELLAGVVNGANYTQDQVDNEGTVLQYMVDLAGTSTPAFNSTDQNNARKWAAVNAQATNQQHWTRSVFSSNADSEWYVFTNGSVGSSIAGSSGRLSPLAVLI